MSDSKWIMCGLCDTTYDPNGPEAEIHEHPEPQSGSPRDAWIKSKMKYSEWIEKTQEGMEWKRYKEGMAIMAEVGQKLRTATERIKELELAIISALSISDIWLPDDGEFFSDDFEEEGKALASMHSNFKNLINIS